MLFRSGCFVLSLGITGAAMGSNMAWREAAASEDSNHFPKRTMTFTGLSTSIQSILPFSEYEDKTCKTFDKAENQLSKTQEAFAQDKINDIELDSIGVHQACTNWKGCRAHAGLRCHWYKKLSALPMMVAVFVGLGYVLFGLGMFAALAGDDRGKIQVGVAAGFLGFVGHFFGILYWGYITDSFQNVIRISSFWPYACLASGFQLAMVGSFMLFAGMLCMIAIAKTTLRKGEEEQGLVDDAASD